ncbi:low affinity immunoglobulin gamma Fc region receptor III-like isoform X2 [Notolabrus celidotus]|uniref:low affinity immunoglobulin gamma Fc region receptor III-like isoform X2 n=1 Tax=Notolabrus celidotus TaxID=1203425 RepID=UPI0014907D47|nr:low affinity immunoglobulin gamma Fc region receptor III-like isoform X2 [Notolabrus celidotus]
MQDNMGVAVLGLRLLVSVSLLLPAQSHNYTLKAGAAFPHIDPQRLHFFEYEYITLNCEGFTGSTEWRVMKNNPLKATGWENSVRSLSIGPAFEVHSGEYWCENGEGERSNALNIVVTAGDVILESPVLPLMEGQTVTLRCKKRLSSNNFVADFYKDGGFKETGYKGKMTIHNVSVSDEGLYKCSISGAGESPESRLTVGAYIEQETPPPPRRGSSHITTWLSVFFSVCFVAVLLSVGGLLHYRKSRVRGFFSHGSTTESAQIYENVSVADQDMSVYANVPRNKNKQGRQGQHKKKTVGALTTARQTRVSGESVLPDTKRSQQKTHRGFQAEDKKETLNVMRTERRGRGHREQKY